MSASAVLGDNTLGPWHQPASVDISHEQPALCACNRNAVSRERGRALFVTKKCEPCMCYADNADDDAPGVAAMDVDGQQAPGVYRSFLFRISFSS